MKLGAKLTLSLHVGPSRPDGFHELDAMVSFLEQPCEKVNLLLNKSGSGPSITLSGITESVPADTNNLAWRALELTCAAANITPDFEIQIHKEIPPGAGLGGGSIDAALVIQQITEMAAQNSVPITQTRVDEIASAIGSDVPVCLFGQSAIMTGRGEKIQPASVPRTPILLVMPAVAISTADVYRAWDEMSGPKGVDVKTEFLGDLRNDLMPAAFQVSPELEDIATQCAEILQTEILMAGSGSSLFAIGEVPEVVRLDVARKTGARVVQTHSLQR